MEVVLCFSCAACLSLRFTKSLSQCSLSWLSSQWFWSGLLLSVWRACQGCCYGCSASKFSRFLCPIDLLWILAPCQRSSCGLGEVIPNLMILCLSPRRSCCTDSRPHPNPNPPISRFSHNFPGNSCIHEKLLEGRNRTLWKRPKMPISLHFSIKVIIWVFGLTHPVVQDGSYCKFFPSNLLDPLLLSFPWPGLLHHSLQISSPWLPCLPQ